METVHEAYPQPLQSRTEPNVGFPLRRRSEGSSGRCPLYMCQSPTAAEAGRSPSRLSAWSCSEPPSGLNVARPRLHLRISRWYGCHGRLSRIRLAATGSRASKPRPISAAISVGLRTLLRSTSPPESKTPPSPDPNAEKTTVPGMMPKAVAKTNGASRIPNTCRHKIDRPEGKHGHQPEKQ
jgi:hypothetical protein